MSVTKMIRSSEWSTSHELQAVVEGRNSNGEFIRVNSPLQVLQSALTALREGRPSEAVEHFDDDFAFSDQALALEFRDKRRLTEFFEKTRELFPDTTLEVVSLFESGDHAITEWKLTGTQTVPYGSIGWRVPISLFGSTIIHVENGRIVRWSEYYDQSSSRRVSLASFFTDWVEY